MKNNKISLLSNHRKFPDVPEDQAVGKGVDQDLDPHLQVQGSMCEELSTNDDRKELEKENQRQANEQACPTDNEGEIINFNTNITSITITHTNEEKMTNENYEETNENYSTNENSDENYKTDEQKQVKMKANGDNKEPKSEKSNKPEQTSPNERKPEENMNTTKKNKKNNEKQDGHKSQPQN